MKTRYFSGFMQRLPQAAFRYVTVVANGADNDLARAFGAEQAYLAGKTFVDGGFRGEWLQIGVFVPGENPEGDPCWRCLHPEIRPGGERYSCEWYARQAEAQGLVPAVQTIAQTAGAIQAEHAILALQEQFPLRNSMFHLNLRTGESLRYSVSRNPDCPSRWHRVGGMARTPLAWKEELTWGEVLQAGEEVASDDVRLEPMAPLVWEMRCVRCLRFMQVRASAWLFEAAPYCVECGGPFSLLLEDPLCPPVATTYHSIAFYTPDALGVRLADCGLYPGDLVLASCLDGPGEWLFELQGDIDTFARSLFQCADAMP